MAAVLSPRRVVAGTFDRLQGLVGRRRLRVDRVQIIRYRGPGRGQGRWYGMVVRIRLAGGGLRPLEGAGESVIASRAMPAAWRSLVKQASTLVGCRFIGDVDALKAGVGGWSPAGPGDRASRRAAKLAIEAALFDAVSRLDNRGRDDAAAAVRQLRYRLPRVAPGAPGETLTAALAADPGSAWAVRLLLTGDDDLDLAWMRHVVSVERAAGRGRPVWLVGGDRSFAQAAAFVSRLARELEPAGELPPRVLLEEPLVRSRDADGGSAAPTSEERGDGSLSALQRLADKTFGHTHGTSRRVLVVASDRDRQGAELADLLKGGPVGAVLLSPARSGTLLGLADTAEAIKRADDSSVVIVDMRHGSMVTGTSLRSLRSVCPAIDVVVHSASGWPTLLATEKTDGTRRRGTSTPIDMDELSTIVDELVTVPAAGPVANPGNLFPDHPLLKVNIAARSLLLETEMLRAGLRTSRFSHGLVLADHSESGRKLGFSDSEPSSTSMAAVTMAGHKGVTRVLLADRGLPVVEGSFHPVDRPREAFEAGTRLGFPLVVKPGAGSRGEAVTVGIRSPEELTRAIEDVAASSYARTGIVVERHAEGHDHRILATSERVVSVIRRRPASVVGDGTHTIEELILATNALRARNPHLEKRPIPLDRRVDDFLKRQSLTRHTVPPRGQRVYVRGEANVHLGGDSFEVRDSTHPSILQLAMDAVAAVPGLSLGGIDLLLEDHRLPADEQNVTIIEVNSRPVPTLHHFPRYGPARNAAGDLVRHAATIAGVTLPEPVDDLTVRLDVFGRVQKVGYRRWLASLAEQLDLSGWVGNPPEPDRVTALVQGRADAVGLLVRLAYYGPAAASVVETRAEPVPPVHVTGFAIREELEAGDGAA